MDSVTCFLVPKNNLPKLNYYMIIKFILVTKLISM